MIHRLKSLVLALATPLVLWGCVLTPGKFVSTLDIRADRSFAFSYVGEVYAVDMGKELGKGLNDGADAAEDAATLKPASLQGDGATDDSEAKNRAIAEALAKEAGYRKVEYAGGGKFLIDYAASGRLTYPFLFPFSSDAEVIFPFVMIELRGGDRVRVRAPAFGADSSKKGMTDSGSGADKLDGSFTLTTDAEIVSQNNENGAATSATGRRVIQWRATPATKDAPMAVLKVAPLGA
ncbi:hypothetical protein [Sphingomonas sp.]|uniref:hypothetical protein n=1 Tax=Sphingomonas sp. TaxID=28214 RepID=UPI002CD544EB|nr:hypothetical protein [Sphingomonas sp.]HWK35905.1 hypothetical protein [Sphingomonas sp.]